jgi:hypothetical protein
MQLLGLRMLLLFTEFLSSCIIRYLKGTISHGLTIHASSQLTLQVFSDADWAGNQDDRTSTRSYCVFFGNSLIF